MSYVYPQSDLERPSVLLGFLGSFWSGTYDGSHDIESFAGARAQLELQTQQNLQEAIDSTSRFKVPPFHTDIWYQMILKESEMNTIDFSIAKYGEGFTYNQEDALLLYGRPTNRDLFAFAIPSTLVKVPSAHNRTDAPTLSWFDGLDYIIEDGYIKFLENPFENELLPVRLVFGTGGVTEDREISLWFFRSEWDQDLPWIHFGHILGIKLPSSYGYRDYINAIFDATVDGSSLESVTNMLSAVADVPVVKEDDETVEVITEDATNILVITDKNAYRYPLGSTVTVEVGDTVHKGQFLTMAIQLYSPGHEEKPDWLAAIAMDESFTDRGYYGGLVFIDQDLPVIVTEESGKTRVELTLMGYRRTLEKFWDDVHANGVSEGKTLANLLDTRPNPTDEPTAESLPATQNPLEFLLDNVLRSNALIALLRPSEFGDNKLPFWVLSALRRMIPPQRTVILMVQLESVEDSVDQDGEETLTPVQWFNELTEDDAVLTGEELLLPAGYTEGICW